MRIGPLTENSARERIGLKFGLRSAESVRIRSLEALLRFVAAGLEADEDTLNWARENIIKAMMKDFCGFKNADTESVEWNQVIITTAVN